MDGKFARKLIQESRDIATIIDSEGTITYVSPSVEDTLGYDPNDLIGEDGFEYQHPADRDAVADAIESVTMNPDDTEIVETRFRHADGSWCWVESTLQNRLSDSDIDGILVNSRDISQRKQQKKPESGACQRVQNTS
jgi:PAS domain S-box-containing protein